MNCTGLALILVLSHAAAQIPATSRYGIVIHEILADPSPVLGLPAAEFIELRNRSGHPIDLRDWGIGDGRSRARIPGGVSLQPDSLLILCPASAAAAFSMFGQTLGLSGFPSLNNDGDLLILTAPDGRIIHAVSYDISWYRNAVKAQGGWSLEMIDPEHPCAGAANWTSSTHAGGGSPGKENSVHATRSDQEGPLLQEVFTTDSLSLTLSFDEPVDSASAARLSHYALDPPAALTGAMALPPLYREVAVTLGNPLAPHQVYKLTVTNIRDCGGVTRPGGQTAKAGLPDIPEAGSLVINEIMFNPRPGAPDYVELYNRSTKILDLRQLYIANRTPTGTLSHMKQVSEKPGSLYPAEFLVLTEDPAALSWIYPVPDRKGLRELKPLPSLPDDRGQLVLLSHSGAVIDELHYDHQWHFALLDGEEGVALERIDPVAPTQDKNNWASAASLSGFGTPGRVNSQFHAAAGGKAGLRIEPAVFSPDNDGYQDRAGIHYELDEPGYLAHITVYDLHGYPVGDPIPLATLSQRGVWWWDGLDRHRQALPSGIYILLVELIHPNKKVVKQKLAVTLARSR